MHRRFWPENLKQRDHFKEIEADKKAILKFVLKSRMLVN
jgi:hypothetical protein